MNLPWLELKDFGFDFSNRAHDDNYSELGRMVNSP